MKIFSIKESSNLNFLGLLVWFLIFFLIGPLFEGYYSGIFIQTSFSIMLLFSVFTLSGNTKYMIIGAVIAIISSGANTYNLINDTFMTEIIAVITSLIFVIYTSAYLFRRVFLVKSIEANMIFGSICIYLLLALAWALFYTLLDLIVPGSFKNITPMTNHGDLLGRKFHDFIYYSLVTQTTLGYGDITPTTTLAKNYAATQSTMGIFYLATLVSGLISQYLKKETIDE